MSLMFFVSLHVSMIIVYFYSTNISGDSVRQ